MYSGFITSKRTVAAIGVHQRINTAAYRAVGSYVDPTRFPSLKQLLHFEGYNGPDGLKVKSPGQHEPSHLYDPIEERGPLPKLIEQHYAALVDALSAQDRVRSAFEASWLAHYVCDGMTPAHHFPLDEKLAEQGAKDRDSDEGFMRQKIGLKGSGAVDTLQKSWKVWGGKGLLSTHFNFEMGVATVLMTRPIVTEIDQVKLADARRLGLETFFKHEAKSVADMDLYTRFYRHGWTASLARIVRNKLAPQIASTIAIIWLLAYLEAEQRAATK